MLTPQITSQGLTKQQLIELGSVMGTGVITGGIISINADNTKFDISAGTGFITDNHTDPLNPVVTMVSWNAMTGISATYLTTANETQLMIDINGNVIQHNYVLTYDESRDYIYLGRIIHAGRTVITNTSNVPKSILSTAENIYDIARAIGPINISGNDVTPDGANLNFNMSAGSIYRFGSNWSNSRKVPNISTINASTPVSFQYRYRNGSGGYTIGTSRTAIDPLKYDDGSGTPANVPNNKWTIQRVYLFSIGTKYVTYGQTIYNSLAEAQLGVLEERPTVDPQFADACLRAFIIVKQNSTNLNDAVNDIIPAGKFGEAGGGSSSTILSSTFEVFNKNLNSYPYTITETSPTVTTITYTTGSGTITKTITEVSPTITTITLSGIPSGIPTTKTITEGATTVITYS